MAHPRSDPAKEYHPAPLAKTERAALPVAPVPAAAAAPPPQQPAAQPAPPAPASSAAAPPPSAASAPAPAVAPTPADPPLLARSDQAECPACHGEGSIACPAHCNHGKLRCPASCLKKDDPGWVPGPDGKMWKTFPAHKPGVLGGHKWSTAHIGQLIVYEDGLPVNKGLCPTCQGTGLVDCQKCEGRGSLVCPLCQGAKMVGKKEADAYLAAVAAERQKNAIHLADGRVIRGKIIGKTPDRIIIQTEDGKTELIDPTTIVDSPASGSK